MYRNGKQPWKFHATLEKSVFKILTYVISCNFGEICFQDYDIFQYYSV